MDQLGDQVAMLQGGRTRLGHTVEEASRNAWENGGFNMGDLDYYNKGLLAGLLLDAEIRNATHGRKSLDDVMRAMYNRYRLPQPGYDEDGILRTVNEVAGVDLSASYALMIRTTGEMPFQDVQAIGLRVVAPDMEAQLPGGWPLPSESVPQDALARLGIRETDAFQGFAPSESEGNAVLELNRDGSTVRLSLPLRPVTAHNYEVMVNPTPTADQAAQLARWLQRPKGS
jgi:predicted metalloprotease with PDZ domain